MIFCVIRGVKGQKISQNDKYKLHLSRAISQEQCSIWSCFLVHLSKMMMSLSLFHFFQILIFWFFKGVKGQKTTQKMTKNCRLHSVSQESYIIWLLFMVYLCKKIITPDVFFISKFWSSRLLVVREVKGKKFSKMIKTYFGRTPCSRNYNIWCDCHSWNMCRMIICSGVFFSFSKFWFSELSWWWKGKKLS